MKALILTLLLAVAVTPATARDHHKDRVTQRVTPWYDGGVHIDRSDGTWTHITGYGTPDEDGDPKRLICGTSGGSTSCFWGY